MSTEAPTTEIRTHPRTLRFHAMDHDTDGEKVEIPAADVQEFRRGLGEPGLLPGDDGFEEARRVWNHMIDHRPGMIARCRSAGDAARCVRFARRHGVALTVRGGGHNVGGRAVADGALLMDFSDWNDVHLDAGAGTVDVAPGALLGDLDRATVPEGAVVPTGIVSETGVAGLTLGGGFGWLSRRWGLTCDHLLEADVVTAEGDELTVDEASHPDLFWALRGGGGGFAAVTRFRFRTRPFGGTVHAGPIVHPGEATAEAAERFRDHVENMPETACALLKLCNAPPKPFLSEEVHGEPVAIHVVCHSDASEDPDLALLRRGQPLADLAEERDFVQFQSMFDGGEPRGRRNYWKSEYLDELDDETLAILVEEAGRLPSAAANIKVFTLGGAVPRLPADATAAAHRDARFIVVFATAWDDPSDDDANVGWARRGWRAVHERSGRGEYVNFLNEDRSEEESRRSLGGVDLERLRRVRERWDPQGVFGGVVG